MRVHSGTEYWVASLGFWPGLPFMMALDPRSRLTAPKYNPPRTWTPQGTIGMGGAATAIYPVATPGGYQIFARIPVPIWDTKRRFPEFEKSICLFQPGDRVKFVPCSVGEFDASRPRSRTAAMSTTSSATRNSRCASTTHGWPPSTPASGSRSGS